MIHNFLSKIILEVLFKMSQGPVTLKEQSRAPQKTSVISRLRLALSRPEGRHLSLC